MMYVLKRFDTSAGRQRHSTRALRADTRWALTRRLEIFYFYLFYFIFLSQEDTCSGLGS